MMAIYYDVNLTESLKKINYTTESYQFIVHQDNLIVDHSHELISKYGDAKWAIVDILNDKYNCLLKEKFDLYNWLNYNEKDEVAYFINEVGSNSLNYSEFKAPYKFHLFLGENGFIIGIEQKGNGFNAYEIDRLQIKENEGAGFNFFRNCKCNIFFDNPNEVRTIYLCYEF